MSILTIEYDRFRSGFLLQVDGFDHNDRAAATLLRDDITVYRGALGKFAAVESNRRLPLRRIHALEKPYVKDAGNTCLPYPPRGASHQQKMEAISSLYRFADIDGDSWRCGLFLIQQTPEHLLLWFTRSDENLPRPDWTREDASMFGLTFWFSQRTVRRYGLTKAPLPLLAGVRLEFAATAIEYPITKVRLSSMDFK